MSSGLNLLFLKHAQALEASRKESPPTRWFREPMTWSFWRTIIAEFLGTALLVFIGTAATISGLMPSHSPNVLNIALSFGLAVMAMVQCFGHVSGTHINPAVTLGLAIVQRISILRAVVYVVAQCVGAVVGSAFLYALVPTRLHGNLGTNLMSDELTSAQGMFVELILTFVLVLVVIGTTDSKRPDIGLASAAIGLTVAVDHIIGIPLSGSAINPARALGPPVVKADFPPYFWIYFVGPLLGGALAGVLYRFVLDPYKGVKEPTVMADGSETIVIKTVNDSET